ncbi:MAG: type II secretion system ATPase GspE [Desulfobacterales bacterium]|nr:type II secretion system ATPase GspE [Desulfobacterales bacterium]
MTSQLSQILHERFELPLEAIAEARAAAARKGERFGDVLVGKKLLSETAFLQALSALYDIPVRAILPLTGLDTKFAQHLPIGFLKRFRLVPILDAGDDNGSVDDGSAMPPPVTVIAINDPSAFQAIDDLVRILGLTTYEVVLSPRDEILSAIHMAYDHSMDSAEQLVQDLEENSHLVIGELEGTADLLDDTSDAPIIKLVNHVISQAIKARASDIHIEPYQDLLKIRYRVDGTLYDLVTPPKWTQSPLISRIKVMAKMNIAEKRLPQDGRLEVRIGDHEIDVRVSTLPTAFGERVVMRLLNKSSNLLGLTELGISPERLEQIQRIAASPNGIMLVTGPTGSGKTTTLYAILSSINTTDINIITIEDPVEYQIRGISQIQVNPKIELTFARGLRSIVRQDPDVILVGEIRDRETADIAVQSALTGHLVFSTLHTNDSASTITRLVDIGIEPFLISSSVIAVAAQRLIRVLCPVCKKPYVPSAGAIVDAAIPPEAINGRQLFEAAGCDHCIQTGYKGRVAIFELMEMNDAIRRLILKDFDATSIRSEALNHGMVSLRRDGIAKAVAGITTVEEVLRVTQK